MTVLYHHLFTYIKSISIYLYNLSNNFNEMFTIVIVNFNPVYNQIFTN